MTAYDQLFLDTFKKSNPDRTMTTEEQALLLKISREHLLDFTSNRRGYFDEALKERLSQLAAEKLSWALKNNSSPLTSALWQKIVVDYYQHNLWGLQPLKKPPQAPEPKDTPTREMIRYLWVFIQAGILMKAIVLYFGLSSAADGRSQDQLFLYFALGFSFLSLAFFGWRLHRKEKEKEERKKDSSPHQTAEKLS